MGIECDINAARVLVLKQNSLPILATIAGTENSTLCIWPEWVPQRRDKDDVRILGIDNHLANGAGIAQANILPCLAAVDRFVDSITVRDVSSDAGFPRAYVNSVGVRLRNGDTADRRSALLIEDRGPRCRAISGFPDATSRRAEIINIQITGNARGCK